MADITNIISTGESIDVSINGSSGINAVLTGTSGINVTLIEGGISYIGTAGYAMSAGESGTASYSVLAGTSSYASSSGFSGTADYSALAGTASFATSSGNAGTADISGTSSYATSSGKSGTSAIAGTASYATSSGNAGTALYSTSAGTAGAADYATSSGQSGTSSYSVLSGTANYATSAGQSGTAVYATESGTSSFATSAGNAGTSDISGTASYATSSGNSGTALYAVTAGTAAFATSSGNAGTSDISGTASYATSAGDSGTALYAVTAGTSAYATSSGNSGTADYATSAGTSYYASSSGQSGTAYYATSAGTSHYATSSGDSGTADYATIAGTANYATSAGQAGTSSAVGNIAAQSVLGNPTGSPAVASAITVAEQTLVGRITGGNVDDLSVAQVKTLLGNASESGVGLAELATVAEAIAGTDTSRIITPAGNAASEAVIKNPLQEAQGVEMTYAASGSTGIMVADDDDIDFGTGDFTLVWRGSLPDWSPTGSYPQLIAKYQDDANRWRLGVYSNTKLYFYIHKTGETTITYETTKAPSTVIADGTVAEITVVITRQSASVAGSAVYYINGVLFESVAIPVGTPLDISNTGSLYVSGSNAARNASRTHFAATYNRALSAAEVLDLYRNGINFADKWGSQTALYTSDFSAGADGWFASKGTVAWNIDSIGGADNWLRFYTNDELSFHYAYKTFSGAIQKKYRLTFNYYIPTSGGSTYLDGISTSIGGIISVAGELLDTIGTASVEFTNTDNIIRISPRKGGVYTFAGANSVTDDLFYIKDLAVTEIGATLALEPEGIQPAPGQWLDSSSNKLHAWQPTTGSTITRKKTEFEIRGINTWTASNAAQSIAMTSDASRAMLPANCYIESIVGVIAGADIEDIIIGNGSDTDYWVELTTGLAAGTVSFMLANRISDGTNYELVVDPDADCTMTITWTIKGYILD